MSTELALEVMGSGIIKLTTSLCTNKNGNNFPPGIDLNDKETITFSSLVS